MQACLYLGTEKLEFKDVDVPFYDTEKEALVEVSYAGVCGTDMMIYSGLHPRAKKSLIMGHEFSGVIKEVNPNSEFRVGDRVAINPLISCGGCEACQLGNYNICENLQYIGIDLNGGFANYTSVPIDNLHLLPDSVSDVDAALIEPLSVAIHCVRKSKLKIGDNVVILGSGPIGVLIGLIAKNAGASNITISDISDYRLEIARNYGFSTVDSRNNDITEVVKTKTKGTGADVVFEVAGNEKTANQAIDIIKKQGEIMVVSVFKKMPKLNLAKMHFNEISLTTTRCYTESEFKTAINMLKEQKVNVKSLVSHKLSLKDYQEGFNLMKKPTDSMKILFSPKGEE